MTAATQPATPAAPNNNEPVRVNHTARNVIITIVVVAIIAVAAFFGYRAFAGANESSAKGSKGNPVKIGVVGATNPEWVKFKQNAEKAGIYVDIVDFQDYTSENPALDSGELDLNEFQHLLYLANYNVSNKKDLQPIGGTAIYPLGVYSTKVNVHGYEEEGSTTTPYDMVRVNRIDRYELTAEALRMLDADKYADKIDELEKYRHQAFQFAVDKGYDHPDYTDWVYSGVNTDKKGAVTATAATAGDNE